MRIFVDIDETICFYPKGRDYYKDLKGRKVQHAEGIEVKESEVFGEGWTFQGGEQVPKGMEGYTKEGTSDVALRKKKPWWEP